jgi:dTDP-4-dehydrorhamnose 3,5-epimerase
MRFVETRLQGAMIIEPERIADDRGFFARTFCADEFREHGLNPNVAQTNISFNPRAGTLRGMHYQVAPAVETKLVRCVRGALVDVIVDMREDSPTYLEHIAVELSDDNGRALFVPALFAHGYQTLVDETEASYVVSSPYAPGFERGLAYDDPELGIDWPLPVSVISDKDRRWPPLSRHAPTVA